MITIKDLAARWNSCKEVNGPSHTTYKWMNIERSQFILTEELDKIELKPMLKKVFSDDLVKDSSINCIMSLVETLEGKRESDRVLAIIIGPGGMREVFKEDLDAIKDFLDLKDNE